MTKGPGEDAPAPPAQKALLLDRRFWPLFWAQALGALNDNLFKGAAVILAVYAGAPGRGATVAMLAGGLLVLPFILFSALAGALADRHPKPRLVRIVKAAEIAVMCLGALAILGGSSALLLFVVFLTGTQSAFFGPLKYGLLPELFRERELLLANAYIEASTFLAILLGTMAGSLLVSLEAGKGLAAAACLAVAVAGFLASLFLPELPAAAPDLRIRLDPRPMLSDVLVYARRRPELWRAILAISWFWAVGGVYLAQVPAHARQMLAVSEQVATLLLAMFVIGIAVGALAVRLALRGRVRLWPVPWAMLAVGLLGIEFALAARLLPPAQEPRDLAAFLATPGSLRLLLDLFLLAAAGGAFAVPLYAHLQLRTPRSHVARIIGANNIMNAFFLVASAGAVAALLSLGLSVSRLLLALGVLDLLAALLLFAWLRQTRAHP